MTVYTLITQHLQYHYIALGDLLHNISTYSYALHSSGSHNIFNGDLKLILGLIWTLVQKYQLRMIGEN